VLVTPQLAAGGKIGVFLDPAKTKICTSTPTGDALLLGADSIMLVVGLTACAVPLRRALRIDPTEALRAEG